MQNRQRIPGTAVNDVEDRRHLSMHEDVPVWHDCCSCEAEPYWVEAFEGQSDYVADYLPGHGPEDAPSGAEEPSAGKVPQGGE